MLYSDGDSNNNYISYDDTCRNADNSYVYLILYRCYTQMYVDFVYPIKLYFYLEISESIPTNQHASTKKLLVYCYSY